MNRRRRWILACVVVTDPLVFDPHEYIVLGRVKSQFGEEVTIQPTKYFKGEPHQRLVAYLSPSDDTDCNPELEQGETYLLYGSRMRPPHRPYLVISSAIAEADASDVLKKLGEGKKPSVSGSNLTPKYESTRGQRASAGIVIGSAVGVVFVLFLIISLIYWFLLRRRHRHLNS